MVHQQGMHRPGNKDESKLRGAPVGLLTDKDGALLIADDVGSAAWRVTASAHRARQR
ncbi:MAG: hypothetical protein WC617_17780 [Rhodanobacter sp.]|jgi:glucose/arabinose dehydrogenase